MRPLSDRRHPALDHTKVFAAISPPDGDELGPRRREEHLPPVGPEEPKERLGARRVELGGDVVEEQDGAHPAGVGDHLDLGGLQGEHDRAVLPLRGCTLNNITSKHKTKLMNYYNLIRIRRVNGVGIEPTSRISAYAANYTSHPF